MKAELKILRIDLNIVNNSRRGRKAVNSAIGMLWRFSVSAYVKSFVKLKETKKIPGIRIAPFFLKWSKVCHNVLSQGTGRNVSLDDHSQNCLDVRNDAFQTDQMCQDSALRIFS